MMNTDPAPHPPLIITLKIDGQSQSLFNEWRQRYFPPAINYLDAHLTLFHHLPSNDPEIENELRQASQIPYFQMKVAEVIHTGFGVAYSISSPELLSIHKSLQSAFMSSLKPQDKQKFRPHITVQNKVSAAESRSLWQELSEKFASFEVMAVGIDSWLYLNGPWQFMRGYNFNNNW